MNYIIKYTDSAREDLREIAIDIAERSKDREIAKRFIGELREKCKLLMVFPDSGALPADRMLRSAGYRYLVHKSYLLFYTVDREAQAVYVQAIFHEGENYVRVMRRFI